MGLTLVDPTQLKNTSTFQFTASIPSGTAAGNLTVPGDNTVTLTPVPPGVSGTDTQHYLYISGGTGTPEAALIVGGTAVSCGLTGTVILRTVNAHSGGWSIQSASAGIKESSNVIGGVGTLMLPPGSSIAQGIIVLPTTISLIGQLATSTAGIIGSVIATSASPGIVIADNRGTATNQGIGVHSKYCLYGPGSGFGIWVGGDPSNVFAPSTWTGSYLRFDDVSCINFSTAVTHYRGNFVSYLDSLFGGLSRALVFPSTGGGEHQPVTSRDCIWSVPTGASIQMDDSGFATNIFQMFGDQISGTITGNDVFIETFGVHFEPNEVNVGLIGITGAAAIIKIHGGLASVHGTTLTSMFGFSGTGTYEFSVEDMQAQADSGMTVANFVSFQTSSGGALAIETNRFAAAGVFTKKFNISKATLDANVSLYVNQPVSQSNTGIAAGASIDFNGANGNYPVMQTVTIFGGTVGGSGITTVSGLTSYCVIPIVTTSVQTFTASGTIGNTFTTTANVVRWCRFDGTQLWG